MSYKADNDVKDIVEVKHVEIATDEDSLKAAEAGVVIQDINDGFDLHQVKRITRKIDLHVVPILAAMYCISLVDRNNLSLARAANENRMHKELRLDIGDRYTIITLMFFVPYIIFEIPSQIGLRKFGARIWLGCATIIWGVIMLCMGFTTKWTELVALRALLGIFEACLFPGAAYLLACWYPRRQMASRNSIFFCSSAVLGGFAGIMTWGISHMNNKGGRSGWQWIFIICGIITVVIGVMGYLLITDFPDRAKFLTEEERQIVATRIQRDRGDAEPDALTLAKIGKYVCDVKLWLFGYFLCCATMGGYSLAYFQPQILTSMGFNNMMSQILTCPPTIWMMIQTVTLAFIADKKKWRAQALIFNGATLIAGTMIYSQLPANQKGARYFGLFLASSGSNGNVPLSVSWAQSNIRSQSKRAYTAALTIAFGGIGGIIASVAFKQNEAAKGFPTGVWLTVAMNSVLIVSATLLKLWFWYQNKRADRGETIIEDHESFRYQ